MRERSIKDINLAVIHASASDIVKDDDIEAIRYLHTQPTTTPIRWGIYHTAGKEWDDVGYHFFIRKDGLIQIGRPIQYDGAHCYGHNTNSIGICFSGHHEFTKPQFISFLNLKYFLSRQYGFDIDYRPHNQFSSKPCPGFILEDELLKHGLL